MHPKDEGRVQAVAPYTSIAMRVRDRLWLVLHALWVFPAVLLGLLGPPTWSGVLYLLSFLLIWAAPLWRRAAKGSIPRRVGPYAGFLLFLVVAAFRVLTPEQESTFYHERVGRPSLLADGLGRLAEEQDLALGASRLFHWAGVLPERGALLQDGFRETYAEMDAHDVHVPSPQLATAFGLQQLEGFDVLRRPREDSAGHVIFLHGYGGSVASICWEISQAAYEAGWSTHCPSWRMRADWSSPRGAAIMAKVLEPLEGPVVLIGLSAGARGAARLAPRYRHRLRGLVLVSGAAVQVPGVHFAGGGPLPTLVIYGRDDAMFSPDVIRAYVRRTQAQSLVLEGGHFILLSERERVRQAITGFLRRR